MIGRLIKWIEGPRLLVSRSLEAAQSSLAAEHKDCPQCPSAQAEGYALGSGACEGLFICVVAKELGVALKLALHSDSTATISQHTKMGLGREKHVELRFLFVKDLLKREELTLCTNSCNMKSC